jgi:SAM-dependent methyltransferase
LKKLSTKDEQEHFRYMQNNVFHVCENRSVLEVGPFNGHYSKVLVQNNIKNLTLIEASENACKILERINWPASKNIKIIHGDMHKDLNLAGKHDVVLLLGVLYHSHAPLHVLEETVNNCDPDYIITDDCKDSLNFGDEIANCPGMRYALADKKTCNIVSYIDQIVLKQAMHNLGYECIIKIYHPQSAYCAGRPINIFKRI